MILQTLIRVILIPGGLAGAAFVLARFLPAMLRYALRSAGVAVGFGAGYILIAGLPTGSVGGSPTGLLVLAGVASFWPLLDYASPRRQWLRRYLIVGALAMVMLRPFMSGNWSTQTILTTLISLAAVSVLVWSQAELALEKMGVAAVGILFTIAGTGMSLLMLAEGSALVSQLAGVYCSVLGLVSALSCLKILQGRGEFVGFAVMGLLGLITGHYFYVEADLTLNLLALSPLVLLPIGVIVGYRVDTIGKLIGLSVVSSMPLGFVLYRIFPTLTQM